MSSTSTAASDSRAPLVRLLAAAASLGAAGLGACGGDGGQAARTQESATGQDSAAPVASVERSPAGLRVTTLDVGGHQVTAEVAERESQRERGLMERDSLPGDHGMLFVYSEPQTLSFWMRNTEVPLDIAFLSPDGVIVDIQQMEPRSDEQHRSREPAMYALEMSQGWFEEHGVTVGDRVRF